MSVNLARSMAKNAVYAKLHGGSISTALLQPAPQCATADPDDDDVDEEDDDPDHEDIDEEEEEDDEDDWDDADDEDFDDE